jgi:hypothetical protein
LFPMLLMSICSAPVGSFGVVSAMTGIGAASGQAAEVDFPRHAQRNSMRNMRPLVAGTTSVWLDGQHGCVQFVLGPLNERSASLSVNLFLMGCTWPEPLKADMELFNSFKILFQ